MGLVRPVLVLRMVESGSASTGAGRTWREIRTLPNRVVLKAGELVQEGAWLSLALLRAGARGYPMPRVIAAEVFPVDTQHSTVIAALLMMDVARRPRQASQRSMLAVLRSWRTTT